MKRFILMLLATTALVACKTIEIENGEVPDEYLARAKKLEGVYSGSFEGRRGEMTIAFEGNRPVLSFKDSRGDSFMPSSCKSSINDLKWVYVNRKEAVDSAAFYFDPGTCFIQGREVVLYFSKDYNTINVRILEYQKTERRCDWSVPDPVRGPIEHCEVNRVDVTLNGKFSR
ncbi:hypothetical protein [Bdellovibrio sp.]|uniref:hypothetical protein n=1 Tax=Bdellovibrio sp. TaxID=28201 RepID=UPI0039E3E869